MTEQNKMTIKIFRESGVSYGEIAKILNLSIDTVKSFCRRNGLTGYKSLRGEDVVVKPCEECGLPVVQNPGRKTKRFCSDKCRMAWWNSHPDKVNHKKTYIIKCSNCGKEFTSNGKKDRKYCSHECYTKAKTRRNS